MKATNSLFWLCLLLVSNTCFSQTKFQKTFGGNGYDRATDVQQTTDGGYIITGSTDSYGAGGTDAFLLKIDATGQQEWFKTYGASSYSEAASSMIQTTDNGYLLAGSVFLNTGGQKNMYLIKTNSTGDTLWTKTYNGYQNSSIRQTGANSFFLTSYDINTKKILLSSIDNLGNTVWSKLIGNGTNSSHTASSSFDNSNSTKITVGTYFSFNGAYSAQSYLIKTNNNGDTLWTKTYGGNGIEVGVKGVKTSGSDFIISGNTDSYGNGGYDIHLLKIDTLGNTIWEKTIGSTNNDFCSDFEPTSSEYIIAGTTNNDALLVKLNNNGDTLWTKVYGGNNTENIFSVATTTDGGYIMVGSSKSFNTGTNEDIYIVKTDANGNSGGCNEWQQSFTVTTPVSQVGYGVAAISSGLTEISVATTVNTPVIDTDSTLCFVLSTEKLTNNNTTTIYPNPTSSTFQLTGEFKNAIVNLFDITGKLVHSQVANSRYTSVSVTTLLKGMYAVQVKNKTTILYIGKIIVE